MADASCYRCNGSGEYPSGTTCPVCEGSGINTGAGFYAIAKATVLAMETKVLELETKLDAFQADMDIIKPQIQALYNDLNP